MTTTTPTGRIIPRPHATWAHKALKYNWFQRVNEKTSFHKEGADAAYTNIPIRLFSKRFLKPMIDYVDDAISDAGIIDPIKQLDDQLLQLREKFEETGSQPLKEHITLQAESLITQFAQQHGAKFKYLEDKLKILQAELKDFQPTSLGQGKAGLEELQVETVKTWINHWIRLSRDAQSSADLLHSYKQNRQAFIDIGKTEGPEISGGMQHYLKMALGAELRIATRNHAGWKPTPGNIWATGLKEVKGIQGIDPDTNQIKDLRAKHVRRIANGKDGVLAGNKYNRYRFSGENIEAFIRDLNEGFYSDKLRIQEVINTPGGGPDNVENFGLVLNTDLRDPKTGMLPNELQIAKDIAGLLYNGYKSGREGDVLEGLRRLAWMQGPEGGRITIPRNVSGELKLLGNQNDPHFMAFVKTSEDNSNVMDHSPSLWGPRYMNQVAEYWTRWIYGARLAPAEDIAGTPGKNSFFRYPRKAVIDYGLAKLTGGKVIENKIEGTDRVNARQQTKLRHYWLPEKKSPDAKRSALSVLFHPVNPISLVKGKAFPVTQSIFNLATLPIWLPLKGIGMAWGYAAKPAIGHTWRTLAPVTAVVTITVGTIFGGSIAKSIGNSFSSDNNSNHGTRVHAVENDYASNSPQARLASRINSMNRLLAGERDQIDIQNYQQKIANLQQQIEAHNYLDILEKEFDGMRHDDPSRGVSEENIQKAKERIGVLEDAYLQIGKAPGHSMADPEDGTLRSPFQFAHAGENEALVRGRSLGKTSPQAEENNLDIA